ncbi:hypothetical protein PENTCL1PPCAC_14762, partial [Pristionchus entomophagus]
MRILAGFFSLVFLVLNPAMYFKVLGELSKLVHESEESPFKPLIFRLIENATSAAAAKHTCDLIVFSVVSTMSLLHVILSIVHMYGCFAGRPALIRPMVVNCFASTLLLLVYLSITIFVVFNVSRPANYSSADAMKFETTQKSNLTMGGIFIVIYMLWDAITLFAYFDIKQLHDDFMYWIVEEMQTQSLQLSSARSGGSSKSPEVSRKESAKSANAEEIPNSSTVADPIKKTSVAQLSLNFHL